MICPPEQSRHFVRAKCEYFTDVQLWPLQSKLDPVGWLANFPDHEDDYATHLLSAFLYFSEALMAQMLEATFQSLSLLPLFPRRPFLLAQGHWRAFLDSLLVTHITGEQPNSTDSGLVFLRMVRQQLGIKQAQIGSPTDAANLLLASGPRPVVFVDDFLGSGRQCVDTWKRQMAVSGGRTVSFDKLATLHGNSFYYCPLVGTEQGIQRIQNECTGLRLICGHVLGDRYNAFSANSAIWPKHLKAGAETFLCDASARAGVPQQQWRGYADLGLTVAFAHSVPDATLPIFYWELNGWTPLIRRT